MPYSLWLTLPQPLKQQLELVIAKLASTYNGPVFEPHLTLVSEIDLNQEVMVEKAQQLSMQLSPLALTLADIAISVTYFQCVVVRVKPTAELLEAYLATTTLFNLKPTLFMPHISLFYGNNSMAEREQIAQTVQLPASDFTASELVVAPALPNPAEWYRVAEFLLGK